MSRLVGRSPARREPRPRHDAMRAPGRAAAALVLGLCAGPAFLSGTASGEASSPGVAETRTKLEKWISTRQLISEERSDWAVEREMLASTRDLLRQRVETLKAEIAKLRDSSTAADEERRELLLARGELQRARHALQERIRALEEQVLALVPRLPEPLQKTLEPLLVQIPEDPENADVQLGRRLVSVLGVLVEAEKFNDTATLSGETRAVEGDRRVQVRTLYWGLGQAVYASAQGGLAGVGRPAAAGWEFTESPELAEEATLLLDIYEGNVDAIRFVRVPVAIVEEPSEGPQP